MAKKRMISMGQISKSSLKRLEEYVEKQKQGDTSGVIVIEPVEDEWKLVLEYLAALPYKDTDPGIYNLNEQESRMTIRIIADWIQEKLDAGGLDLDELEALNTYRLKKL